MDTPAHTTASSNGDPLLADYQALAQEYTALVQEKKSIIAALKKLKARVHEIADKRKIHAVMKQLTDS